MSKRHPENDVTPDNASQSESPAFHRLLDGGGRTLYYDLIVGILLIVAGVFAIVIAAVYFCVAHEGKQRQEVIRSEFRNYLNASPKRSTWEIENTHIYHTNTPLLEGLQIQRLVLRDRDGTILFTTHADDIGGLYKKQISITANGQNVATLDVMMNSSALYNRRHQVLGIGLISLAAALIVLMVTIKIVLKRFLLAPLDQLIQHTERISRGEYKTIDFKAPQIEIRTIVNQFNKMVEHIHRREQSLLMMNVRLEKAISEHQEAESDLVNSRQELDSIIRSTPDVIYRLDTSGRFTFVSDAIRRYGLDPDALTGKLFLDYVHAEDREIARGRINDRRTGNSAVQRITIRAFGDYRPDYALTEPETENFDPVFLVDAEGLHVSGESDIRVFVGTQGIARDITEQCKIESLRQESEERLTLALDVSGAGIWHLDIKSGHLELDERIHTPLGYAKSDLAMGISFIQTRIEPETWDVLKQKFDRHLSGDSAIFDHEFPLLSTDGQWRWFHTKAKIVHPTVMVGIIIDTSERKEAEAERERLKIKLQQAQKMEAIGTLAGGIAHDFNNILGAIYGYSQLIQMYAAENARIMGYVDNIFKASERAKGLVQQILTFSRQGISKKTPSDIAIVLKEAVKLIRASIPATIHIVLNIPTGLGTVMADQTQLHQVLMNLCTNAAHAMEVQGGQLSVTLSRVETTPDDVSTGDDLPPGKYLLLTVSDTGMGMDTPLLERIFEPYFTTKVVGEGTGMGLATVHGIVSDHGGWIFVDSEIGKGSVFRIYFPLLENPAKTADPGKIACPEGMERILFVDDEEFLVTVGKEMLEKLGYHVTITTDPIHALKLFTADPDLFDLLITDMTMPGMTGDQLASRIMDIRSDMPVVICTGYSKRMSSERAKALGIRAFMMKPISLETLSQTVRQVLDHPNEAFLPDDA